MDGQVQDERVQDGPDVIVTEFAAWVKRMALKAPQMKDEADMRGLEMELRDGGRAILLQLMQRSAQVAVDAQQEATRICPRCQARRRHQGVRPRQLLCSFGSLTVNGIYWRCNRCGECGHSADGVLAESMRRVMRGMVCLLGGVAGQLRQGGTGVAADHRRRSGRQHDCSSRAARSGSLTR